MIIIFTTHVTTAFQTYYCFVERVSFSGVVTWSQSNSKFPKIKTCVSFDFGPIERWCNLRNGGEPVHQSLHPMTQGPRPCATGVPAASLEAPTSAWLMCCFLFGPKGWISMASSPDDAEGTLTPVDFIQLQHYMECKTPSWLQLVIILQLSVDERSKMSTFCYSLCY